LDLFEVIFVAIGLAIDAFVVSVSSAGTGWINSKRAVFRLSFHFGLFQFLMPVIGWFIGSKLEPIIATYDHWVAFILLQIVAIRMIGSGAGPDRAAASTDPSRGLNLVMLSLATSIDALAVGFSLAMIEVNIWYPSVIIGLITALMSLTGIRLGRVFSKKLGRSMAISGAIILSIIGFRILFS